MMNMLVSVLPLLLALAPSPATAVTCYKCQSWKDYRCLDSFDYQPFPEVNCDHEDWARERKPVFCEKVTEQVDGIYVTTRGCSISYSWDDLTAYTDHRGGHIPCIQRGKKTTCLCTNNSCNAGSLVTPLTALTILGAVASRILAVY